MAFKKRLLTIAGAALIGILPACGQTKPEKPEPIRVGAYEIYVLQETVSAGKTDILIDAPADVLAQYAPDGSFPMATNAVLVRKNDHVWIIDTGFGRTIFDKMAALGIAPGDVDQVLLTHLHGDHIGGMLRDGARAFANATVSLAQREFDHWTGVQDKTSLAIFAAYGDAVRPCSPVPIDASMPEGITPVAAYGHTPGHTMFMIRDNGESLLVWGDLTHAMAVQMPHPEISVRYDSDPVQACEVRQKVLHHIAAAGIPVVGMHIATTSAGKVVAAGSGYEFQVCR